MSYFSNAARILHGLKCFPLSQCLGALDLISIAEASGCRQGSGEVDIDTTIVDGTKAYASLHVLLAEIVADTLSISRKITINDSLQRLLTHLKHRPRSTLSTTNAHVRYTG